MALLTLDEAKAQLNISGTTNDVELLAYINALTAVVEGYVGPVESRTVTETHDVSSVRLLALRQTPAVALTTVAAVLAGGTAYEVADLDLDGDTGIVRRLDGGLLRGPLRVTYTVGRGEVPPTINLATRIILQHMWRTQRGSARGPAVAGSDDYSVTEPIPGLGYSVPNRALELLQPYRLPPGVA